MPSEFLPRRACGDGAGLDVGQHGVCPGEAEAGLCGQTSVQQRPVCDALQREPDPGVPASLLWADVPTGNGPAVAADFRQPGPVEAGGCAPWPHRGDCDRGCGGHRRCHLGLQPLFTGGAKGRRYSKALLGNGIPGRIMTFWGMRFGAFPFFGGRGNYRKKPVTGSCNSKEFPL